MKKRKIEARRRLRNPSIVLGCTPRLLELSISSEQFLLCCALQYLFPRLWGLGCQGTGHGVCSRLRGERVISRCPWKGKSNRWKAREAVRDARGMDRPQQQTQECSSQRCHTGGNGEGSPRLGSQGPQGRREHWQSCCGEPWAGCRSRQRSAGLKGLHLASDYTLSDSSLCFQLLASINIVMLELEKQQKFLQCSPHPLWVLNIFRVWKSSLDQLLFWISQGRQQKPGGTEEEHQLTAWILPVLHMISLSACLTLHKHEITVCLFTAPLPALHVAFASCLTHSKTNPLSYHPWVMINTTVGRDTESAKHFYLWS